MASGYCSESDARAVESFLKPRIDALPGGPRNMAGTLEAIRLCAALAEHQGPSAQAFFDR